MDRGDFVQAIALAEEALAERQHEQNGADLATLLHLIGTAYHRARNLVPAIDAFRRCLAFRESLDDKRGMAATLNNLGAALVSSEDSSGALAAFQRSITLHHDLDDQVGEANALTNCAVLRKNLGDTATSLEMLHRALRIYEEAGETRKTGLVLLNIATNYAVLEDARSALEFAERGIPLLESVQDRYHCALAYNMVGTAQVQRQNYATALTWYERSLPILEEINVVAMVAMTHYDIGEALIHLERFDEARDHLERSLALCSPHQDQRARCECLTRFGQLFNSAKYAHHDRDRALAYYEEARAIAESLDALKQLIPIYHALADIYEHRGEFRQALFFHRLLLDTEKRIFRDGSDQRIRNLQIQFDLEKARQAAMVAERDARIARQEVEIARITTTELADALAEAERLRELAVAHSRRDGLTNVFNRRYMDEILATECERATRHDKTLAVALIDIDHFKQVNDRFGHAVGDEALRTVARILLENCRYGDMVARYGGEEFALILPNTDTPMAYALCEQVRVIVQNTPWETIAPGLGVTISVGLSQVSVAFAGAHEQLVSPSVLLKVADTNLYTAKKSGRNRVVV